MGVIVTGSPVIQSWVSVVEGILALLRTSSADLFVVDRIVDLDYLLSNRWSFAYLLLLLLVVRSACRSSSSSGVASVSLVTSGCFLRSYR